MMDIKVSNRLGQGMMFASLAAFGGLMFLAGNFEALDFRVAPIGIAKSLVMLAGALALVGVCVGGRSGLDDVQ